jgi:inner membrane protein
VLPAVFSRSKPKPRGRLAAIFALVCVVVLWTGRAYTKSKIEQALKRQTFNSEPALRVSAYPYWLPDPHWRIRLRWSAVVETSSSYVTSEVDPSTLLLNANMAVIPKTVETPAILAAKRSYVGRVYLDWARYPVVTEKSGGEDVVVSFWDLRFGYPDTRRTLLGASVTLDQNLRVIGEAMGPAKQNPPID